MKILAMCAVLLGAVAACSSSQSGNGGGDHDSGVAGQDATPGQDSPDDLPLTPACTSDAGPPAPSDFSDSPLCSPGSCTLASELAGTPDITSYALGSTFSVGGAAIDVDFGTGGHIHLQLAAAVADGQAATASGNMLIPAEGPNAGTTYCFGDGTRLQRVTDDGVTQLRFIATCVSNGCGAGAAALAGEIQGCCQQ